MKFNSKILFIFLLSTTLVVCTEKRKSEPENEPEELGEDEEVPAGANINKEDRVMLLNSDGETDVQKQSPGFFFLF